MSLEFKFIYEYFFNGDFFTLGSFSDSYINSLYSLIDVYSIYSVYS